MKYMSITFKDFLGETPLPDDWDKSVYSNATSFKKKIEYAVARAEKIGTGSSRVAFEIKYQGRPTILKIAKNAKGIAQNQEEINILNDGSCPDILIPMIDYDIDSREATWLHVEKAEKATEKKLCKIMNIPSLHTLTRAGSLNNRWRDNAISEIREFNNDDDKSEIAMEFVDQLSVLEQSYITPHIRM